MTTRENKRYPVWQLTDGTIVVQAEMGQVTDDRLRSVQSVDGRAVKGLALLKHRLYTLLEHI